MKILRIVTLTIEPTHTERFKQIYFSNYNAIIAFPGCHSLNLVQDFTYCNKYATISIWTSEDNLEAYRHSELFQNIWPQLKSLFAEKADAKSYKLLS